MSNKIDQIININITRSTKTITQIGFGIQIILGESMKLDRRVKSYTNITEVLVDFAETDAEYKMANQAFSQEVSPDEIYIGKKVEIGSTAIVSAENITDNIVTINQPNHNAETGATVTVIGFDQAEYNGSFEITKIDDDNYSYDAGQVLSVTPATGTGSSTISETWSNAVQKCNDYDSSWYGLSIISNVEADILSVASKVESLGKLFFARTSDTDNLDSSDVNSVLYKLKNLNYDRTATTFKRDTTNEFIDSSWLGRGLPEVPGSINWAFKLAKGVTGDNLLSSESSAIFDNNGNTYEKITNDNSITRYGTVASGEFIDVIRGGDELKAGIQNEILTLLVNVDKIPFTDGGAGMIYNAIKNRLDLSVANGLIAADADGNGIYTINVPRPSELPQADIASRTWTNITFDATLAGAVNKIKIEGNLSLT